MNNETKEILDILKKCKDYDLDYITNLQEENKESEEAVYYWQKQCDLKQDRIDKAIEYIKEHCEIIRFEKENVDMIGKVEGIPLLNILQGSDEE